MLTLLNAKPRGYCLNVNETQQIHTHASDRKYGPFLTGLHFLLLIAALMVQHWLLYSDLRINKWLVYTQNSLWLISFALLVALVLKDPGYIVADSNVSFQTVLEQHQQADVREKVCFNCELIKPRSSRHCYTCGRCVYRFDHHCPYLNRCVGQSNYAIFCTYLVTAATTLILTLALAAYFAYKALSSDIQFFHEPHNTTFH
jgi:palmitoyltransferase